MTTLNENELTQLENLRMQARNHQIGFWQIYQWLGELLLSKRVAATDSTVIWLKGATEANYGRGAMAALIRTYTETQYRLRYGTAIPTGKLQEASDAVAGNLLHDLLGENADWPRGEVPDISRIAQADATAVGRVLFNADPDDSADELKQNSAWAGTLLFTPLGSDQTGRLMGTGDSNSIDTLSDWRDVLFAHAAYGKGLRAAYTAYWAGDEDQKDRDFKTLDLTITAYLKSSGGYSALLDTIVRGTSNPVLKAAFTVIGDAGDNLFLDMLMGAASGKSLLGGTTDVNFGARAQSFFSAYGTTLKNIDAVLLPRDASTLAQQAQADIHVRAALAALSFVRVDAISVAASDRLGFFDPATRLGDITQGWIVDRAAFLANFYKKLDGLGGIVNGGANQRFFDVATETEVLVGAGSAQRQQYVFGAEAADVIRGQGFGDRLYGGAGNDSLIGLGGSDYLQGDQGDDSLDGGQGNDVLYGGAGFDTYVIGFDSGTDTIVDADGKGVVTIADRQLMGGGTLIRTADASQPYTVWEAPSVAGSPIRYSLNVLTKILTIAGAGSTVIIENFLNGNLGIVIPSADTPLPPDTPTYSFDLSTLQERRTLAALTPAQQNQNLLLRNAVVNPSLLGVSGFAGNDTLSGGDAIAPIGSFLKGAGGDDEIWAKQITSLPNAIAAGEAEAADNSGTLMLIGDKGDDRLIGAAGNDVLFGGVGDDELIGGAGSDIIIADGDASGYATSESVDSWSSGQNGPTGPRWLRLRTDAARIGYTNTNSSGSRSTTYAYIDVNINPLANTDLSGLLEMQAQNVVQEINDGNVYLPNTQLSYAKIHDGRYFGTNVGYGADIVYAGGGDDVVNAGGGDDIIFAGTGADMVAGYEGNDFIDGGKGDDILWGDFIADNGANARENHTKFGASWTVTLELDPAVHGQDYIDGGDGSDTIYGGASEDILYGGSGDDVIYGDDFGVATAYAGDDYLDGGVGNDELDGGAGSDELLGGDGDDVLFGDSKSTLEADQGNDKLDGGGGNDYLEGGGGDDSLVGGAGNDELHGDTDGLTASLHGNDELHGNDGNDTMFGDGGDDTLEGGRGDDVLNGGAGNNTYLFKRGDGQDVIQAAVVSTSGASNTLQFGADITKSDINAIRQGADLLLQIRGTSDAVRIASFYLSGASANVHNPVQKILFTDASILAISGAQATTSGASGPNRLAGTENPDFLLGGDGDDHLYGLGGDDYLDGGAGHNELIGGEGDDIYGVGGGSSFARDYSLSSNDVYRYQFGDGRLSIEDKGGIDRIDLGNSIAPSDVKVVIGYYGGSSDSVTLIFKNDIAQSISWSRVFSDATGAFESATSFEAIRFTDGTVWTIEDIKPKALLTSSGNDTINAFETSEIIDGGSGDDTINSKDGNDTIFGGDGSDKLRGDGGDDQLFGGAGNDDLAGMMGNDILYGGLGDDRLSGYFGDDTYRYDLGDGNDYIWENLGSHAPYRSGFDIVEFGSRISPSNIADVELRRGDVKFTFSDGGTLSLHSMYIHIEGVVDRCEAIEEIRFFDGTVWTWEQLPARITTLRGDEDHDVLIGREQAEKIYGLKGNDELVGNGGNDSLYGGTGFDVLRGGDGNDFLSGDAGDDSLIGGLGDDTYIVDSVGDSVIEYSGEGFDIVQSSVSISVNYEHTAGVENLTLTGSASINATGNDLNNLITGNGANNQLVGGGGNDTLNGGAGNDTLMGGLGDDTYIVNAPGDVVTELVNEGTDLVQSSASYTLSANVENLTLTGTGAINGTGNAAANSLTGNTGANRLDGGASADLMTGGAGNDVYVVDDVGDVIVEAAGGGTDSVESSISYSLTAELEKLTLAGTANTNATGNGLANTLIGNTGANRLDGGVGADSMTGGGGNDIYVVDNASDQTIEVAGGGTDTVEASLNWTLASDVENLVLTGVAAINGTGNTLANVLTGNSGNNVLSGGAGSDTLIGGAGNDTYVVDAAGDVVTELANEGTDLVQSSASYTLSANVENLTLTGWSAINAIGNAADNVLTGNSANNALTGGSGNDTLDGLGGADTLAGGTGDDTYYVDNASDVVTELAGEGNDTVVSTLTHTLASNVENLRLNAAGAINGTGNTLDNILYAGAGNNTLNGLGGTDTVSYLYASSAVTVSLAVISAQATGGSGSDTLQNIENLTGSAFNDTLTGSTGANVIDGGVGSDMLAGGAGNDSYQLGRGHGSDTIVENDATAGNADVALFGSDIATDQLWFRQTGNNLEVSVIGTSDKFTLNNWYLGSQYHVEQFRTTNGRILSDSNVQNLVQAMASFSPPAAGQTTLPPSYQSSLGSVIAANWQ